VEVFVRAGYICAGESLREPGAGHGRTIARLPTARTGRFRLRPVLDRTRMTAPELRIVILGDVHAREEHFEASLGLMARERTDLAVLVGDIGEDPPWAAAERYEHRGAHDDSVRRVLRRVGESLACPVAFVPGNHDLPDPGETPGVNVDGKVETLAGLTVAGLGGAGPARFGFAYEWSERQAAARLESAFGAGPIDVFVSHAPPAGTALDVTVEGHHVGSRAVGEWIERSRPRLFVCGHIHEAWGSEVLHGVPCLNAGSMGEPYGQVIAWSVDWQDGPRRIRSLRRDGHGPTEVRVWPPA
jgi:Icc-related predicted phosphoesterase